ncbi:MAG: anti-sigma factor antagonist [candidate division Zixibacteria bacterium]|jgi:anti-sigma B factor antagonist|nr:anti-sigma factor antagonist [candidate division Zixibacteria bacterium]
MKLNSYEKDGVHVVEIKGQLMGGPDTGELDEKLYSIIGQDKKKAVVDLKDCDWINSSGLSILIHHYKKFRDAGGELKLASLTNKVERIMVISRLTEVFDVHDSIDDAVKAF